MSLLDQNRDFEDGAFIIRLLINPNVDSLKAVFVFLHYCSITCKLTFWCERHTRKILVDGPILLFRVRANVVKGCLDHGLETAMVESGDK